ncbi:hypothetical protein [Poseidonibacter ostreae]|nr:hypothetical protein [Poseidonibacter ostreae]
MKKLIKVILLLALSASLLNGGMIWEATKDAGKGATVYGAKKAWGYYKKNKPKKLHKNSKNYKGDSHVYSIENKKGAYKIGESSQGKNKYGKSKRAEQQVRKLQRETGDSSFKSKIRKDFNSKEKARKYETKFIEKTRAFFGKNKDDKSILLGNKINR